MSPPEATRPLRRWRAPLLAAGYGTLVLLIYAGSGGRRLTEAAHFYLTYLGMVAAWTLGAQALHGRGKIRETGGVRSWVPLLRRRPPAAPLRALEEVERAVEFATASAFDVHFRLRPHLVEIAEHRLAARGVAISAEPDRAAALLGGEAWELLRPGRPAPEDRNSAGLDLGAQERVVAALERL